MRFWSEGLDYIFYLRFYDFKELILQMQTPSKVSVVSLKLILFSIPILVKYMQQSVISIQCSPNTVDKNFNKTSLNRWIIVWMTTGRRGCA